MNRIKSLEKILNEQGLDGLFLTKETNIRYMTGFTGAESYAVISPNGRAFITDSRYTEQAHNECKDYEIVKWGAPSPNLQETLRTVCERLNIKKLGFEKDFMNVSFYERLKSELDGIDFIGTTGLVEKMRRVKDAQEIEYLKTAAKICDESFKEVLNFVKVGVTEKDIERELQYIMKKKGADDLGFPSIIATGNSSSMPHYIPANKPVADGDFLLFDIGAMYKGYRSDMTRTIVVGHATDKQREVYNLVNLSRETSANTVKAGVDGRIPHNTAKEVLKKAGAEGIFECGVGHGIGLDIHEDPFMNTRCDLTLEAGNVLTIEPGIYIPGWGGVRIEDSMIVKDDGYEIITKSPKELLIV